MRDSKGYGHLRFESKITILNLEVSFASAASMRQDEGSSSRSESLFFAALGPFLDTALRPTPHCLETLLFYIYLDLVCFRPERKEEHFSIATFFFFRCRALG